MMKRFRSAGLRALREFACVPLKALPVTQRSMALDRLVGSMISEVEVPGGILSLATPTPLLQARARSALSKETDTIAWIDRFESSDVFWDVGANIGVFSLYAALCSRALVLAFEPSAANYMVLCRNIQINALGDRIVPYCIALAGTTKLGVLNLSSQEMGAAVHQFGSPGETSCYWDGEICYAQGMAGYAIDDFIRQFKPPFPAHLKIDVDGLEMPILRGATQTLRDKRLRSIMVELSIDGHGESEGVLASLMDAGFALVSRGDVQTSAGHTAANHLFARMPQ